VPFTGYAWPTIAGEVRRYLRDSSWAVRPPRDLQEQAVLVERAITELLHDLGYSPTVEQIAGRTGLSFEGVLEARQALRARTAASLSAPATADEREHHLEDRVGSLDAGFADVDDRASVEYLMRDLSAQERDLLRLRLEEDLTQKDIGQRLGVSQMQVSRLLRRALHKLAHPAAKLTAPDDHLHVRPSPASSRDRRRETAPGVGSRVVAQRAEALLRRGAHALHGNGADASFPHPPPTAMSPNRPAKKGRHAEGSDHRVSRT
jgi:RNA polymerase sigma factor (sigma-70 family)